MKLTLDNKEIEVGVAKAKHILQIEERLGKPITKIGNEPSFADLFKVFCVAIVASEPTMTDEWLAENIGFEHMTLMSEVISDFLAIPNT